MIDRGEESYLTLDLFGKEPIAMLSRLSQALALLLALWGTTVHGADEVAPNIVVIYADDLGYGDLGCYGATKVKTRTSIGWRRVGIRFTDAHAPAPPARRRGMRLLTGEYAWRQQGTNILPGDASTDHQAGADHRARVAQAGGLQDRGCGQVAPPDLAKGRSTGIGDPAGTARGAGVRLLVHPPGDGDRVRCVYVKDRHVVGLDPKDPIRVDYVNPVGDEPTGRSNPEQLKVKLSHGHDNTIVRRISRIGYMTGGKAAALG